MTRAIRFLRGRVALRDESGIALIMAVGIMFVLSVTLIGLIQYTSANSRSASRSQAAQEARSLAEAGINNGLAVLFGAVDPEAPALLTPARTSNYENGSVTWSGTFNVPLQLWQLTATGFVKNPTGPGTSDVQRTLKVNVPLRRVLTQPDDGGAWNWVYAARSTGSICDMTIEQSVDLAARLWVNGNLCLQNTAVITRGPLVVGGRVTLYQFANAIGTPTNRISEAHIAGGCQYKNQPLHIPCHGPQVPTAPGQPVDPVPADADNVFVAAGGFSATLPNPPVEFPTAEWELWYTKGAPGPFRPCYTQSGITPIFDVPTDVAANLATPSPTPLHRNMNKNVPTIFNLTPPNSYSCKTPGGELTWNATSRVLTVKGTIFIDGSVVVENGVTNTYVGQATIYATGTVLIKNSQLCAVLTPDKTACNVNDPGAWDPNQTMLIFAARGNGANGGHEAQVAVGDGVQLVSAAFQGGLYAEANVDVTTTSRAQGPMIGSTVMLGQTGRIEFPTINVLPAGAPGLPVPQAILDPPQDFG